jgi:nucleotide-binding universal stress UspA family protein
MKAKLLQKLLVPMDGSELGEKALTYAAEIAGAIGAEVQLVCVPLHGDPETKHMCDVYIGKKAEQLQSALVKKNKSATVRPVLLDEGEPATAVVDYAQKEQIGLIVLTSHGRSGIMPWTMGSTASKIIHASQVPVLLIRAGTAIPKPEEGLFGKILLPLDGSPTGEAALPYVQEISGALGSKVVILRVVDTEVRGYSLGHVPYPEQLLKEGEQDADKYLGLVKNNFSAGMARTVFKEGNAAREILKVSEEEKVNIVAMSTHGRSGIDRWMLGSVSDKVLQVGKVPLLLVPPKLSVEK